MMRQEMDTGMYCFISIARYHEMDVNPNQVRHALAIEGKMTQSDIVNAAKEIHIKSKIAKISYEQLDKMVLPAIIQLQNGDFAIVAQIAQDKVLCLFAGEDAPRVLTKEELIHQWNHKIILFTRRSWKKSDTAFGIRWFIPDIIKYKQQLIQVFTGSLTIQILGLFSPMIIQVVIDKVLVHNSLSTLQVLAAGLFLIAVFETIMGIAKNVVFTNTTSKIDVLLSARLFKHLFTLPFRYFEVRRIGDTIARKTFGNFLPALR